MAPFSMSTEDYKAQPRNGWLAVLKRATVSLFFGVLVATGVAAAVWAGQSSDNEPTTCRNDRASGWL